MSYVHLWTLLSWFYSWSKSVILGTSYNDSLYLWILTICSWSSSWNTLIPKLVCIRILHTISVWLLPNYKHRYPYWGPMPCSNKIFVKLMFIPLSLLCPFLAPPPLPVSYASRLFSVLKFFVFSENSEKYFGASFSFSCHQVWNICWFTLHGVFSWMQLLYCKNFKDIICFYLLILTVKWHRMGVWNWRLKAEDPRSMLMWLKWRSLQRKGWKTDCKRYSIGHPSHKKHMQDKRNITDYSWEKSRISNRWRNWKVKMRGRTPKNVTSMPIVPELCKAGDMKKWHSRSRNVKDSL
jgi:hypothetical protein